MTYDTRLRGPVRGGATAAVRQTLERIRGGWQPRAAWAQGQEVIPGLPYTTTPGAVFIDQTTGISAYIDATGTLVPGLPPTPPTEVYVNSTGGAFDPTPVSLYVTLAPAAAAALESYGLPAVGANPVVASTTGGDAFPTPVTPDLAPVLLLGGAAVALLVLTQR